MIPTLTFKRDEFLLAYEEWGCNCGPSALAIALQVTLDDVRGALPGFEDRHYTNPTMMRSALAHFGRAFDVVRLPAEEDMFHDRVALVRIQWTGPWTHPKPAKWASKFTHWIVCWSQGVEKMLFDCNGGIQRFDPWDRFVATQITDAISRADGGWYPANIWRLEG